MRQKRQSRNVNAGIIADTAYRVDDAADVKNAEAGFGDKGRGLHYVAETDTATGFTKAQKTRTTGWPFS